MERSFEDATAFVRVARRRHGGVKDASTSKQLQEDYDALLAENNDDENDDAGREDGGRRTRERVCVVDASV
jgi:hypothetical protein